MTWFKVDDGLPFHPKVVQAGNAAMGLWVRAGAWSSDQLTDGFIPDGMLRSFGSTGEARRLVEAGLWIRVPGGYQFHQWADDGAGNKRQPTRVEVEQERAAARDRMNRVRSKKRTGSPDVRANTGRTTGEVRPMFHDPVPVPNLLLTLVSRLAAGNAHEPPPAETIAAWQEIAGPSVDLVVEAKAYLARFGDRPADDERGAWLGWLRAARKRAARPAATVTVLHPTPTPSTPECPMHPGEPTGSKACPRCAAEAAPAPDLRHLMETR